MPCHGKNSVFASLVLPIRPRLNALLTCSRKIEGGNVAVFDELIECGHIGRRDLLPRCQLLVELPAQHLEDIILRLGWRAIAALNDGAKRMQLLVQLLWKVQDGLRYVR